MQPLSLVLDGRADRSLLGGKGSSIDWLIATGFPVPPTGAVTTAAYRTFVKEGTLASFVEDLRRSDRTDTPTVEEIDAVFMEAPMPDDLAAAIAAIGDRIGDGSPVAVRSSATTEDLRASSFAGQYRSSLNVDGANALERAVRMTWASLWHPAPRTYRRFRGVPEDDLAMGVIVMRMVPATLAGVSFTEDPGGAQDCMRIEAVRGLAEALVSGKLVPEAHVVPRDALPILDEPLSEVASLSLAIERAADAPQDVEWAFDGSQVWIVQSRPITVQHGGIVPDDGFDSPARGEQTRYSTAGIVEMLPGVLPPLVWDLNSWIMEEAFRRVLDSLGGLPDEIGEPLALLRRARGRAALNLDLLSGIADRMQGGSGVELERQYLGDPTIRDEPAPDGRRGVGLRSLIHDLRVASTRRRSVLDSEIVIQATREIVQHLPPLPELPARELYALRRRLLDLAARTAAAELGVAAAAVAAYRRLELLLLPHLGQKEAGRQAQLLTVDPSLALGRDGEGRAGSMAVFAGPTWDEIPEQHRIAVPSREERPTAIPDRDEARLALEGTLRSRRSWRTTRILTGQVVDVRMHVLRRTISDATELLARRERTKAALLDLGGAVRRIHLELGSRLVAAGALAEGSDVDLLSDVELERAFERLPAPSEIERRRRCLQRFEEAGPLPLVFTGTPEPPRAPAPSGDRFNGWGASAGRYTGRARVLSSPHGADFERGDVLVARATDGSWSPLFMLAGAVVVEQAGPLSHAAIIARELGVPAVVNIPGVTTRLRATRARVTVDGDEGLVIVHGSNTTGPERAATEGEVLAS